MPHCAEEEGDFLLAMACAGAELPIFAHDNLRCRWERMGGEELITEDKGSGGHRFNLLVLAQ